MYTATMCNTFARHSFPQVLTDCSERPNVDTVQCCAAMLPPRCPVQHAMLPRCLTTIEINRLLQWGHVIRVTCCVDLALLWQKHACKA